MSISEENILSMLVSYGEIKAAFDHAASYRHALSFLQEPQLLDHKVFLIHIYCSLSTLAYMRKDDNYHTVAVNAVNEIISDVDISRIGELSLTLLCVTLERGAFYMAASSGHFEQAKENFGNVVRLVLSIPNEHIVIRQREILRTHAMLAVLESQTHPEQARKRFLHIIEWYPVENRSDMLFRGVVLKQLTAGAHLPQGEKEGHSRA